MDVTAFTRSAMGTLGRVGEVMYEVSYVCVQLPGDYVCEVGS